MYRYTSPPRRIRIGFVRNWDFIPPVDDAMALRIYDERGRFVEIITESIDRCCFIIVMSLKSTKRLDHRYVAFSDSLLNHGLEAMREMVVIRIRDLFSAETNNLDKFKFHGFHDIVKSLGIEYPMPNMETNNSIARIIKRRQFYSAKRTHDNSNYSESKNRLHAYDLLIALSYISKVEESLRQLQDFDPFEILLNDTLDRDGPLFWNSVYETVTGRDSYIHVGDDYINTDEFNEYLLNAHKELFAIRKRVSLRI